MKDFEYFEPTTLSEAISLLSKYKGGAKVIAGGTDLLVRMKQRITNPECLINIKRIPHLDKIDYNERDGFRIGALVTLHSLETSHLIRDRINILTQAAHKVGGARIRSMGTIGGNLCQDSKCPYYARIGGWGRVPCYQRGGDICYLVKGAKSCQAMATAETAPALICLDAKAKITGPQGERTVAMEDFFISAGVTVLGIDEILTTVEIPNPPAYTTGAYLREGVRKASDFAVAGAAVLLTLESPGGACRDARISLIGVARTPIRAKKADGIIKGKKITDSLITQAAQVASEEARPVSDIYRSATYRRVRVNELVQQAARQVMEAA